MRKSIFLFLVFIFILIAATPYIDGYLFKSTFLAKTISLAKESANSQVNIEIQEYKLGWFNSHVLIRITPVGSQLRNIFSNSISVEYNISHGPLAYNTKKNKYVLAYAVFSSNINLPPETQMQWFGKVSNQPVLNIQTQVSFNNTWTQQISSGTFIIPNVGTIQFAGLTGVTNFILKNNLLKEVKSSARIGKISLKGDEQSSQIHDFLIPSITVFQDSVKQGIGAWNSTSELSIPHFSIQWKNGKVITVDNIKISSMRSRSIDTYNLFNNTFNLFVKRLETKNSIIPSISELNYNSSINNLNPNGLNDYLNYLNFIPSSHQNTTVTIEDRKRQQQLFLSMITPTTNMTVNSRLETSQGKLTFLSKIFFQPRISTPISFEDVIKHFSIENYIRIAEPLLNNIVEAVITKFNSAITAQQASMQQSMQATSMVDANKVDPMQQQVSNLLQQGKISLQVSMQILEIANQHMPTAIFLEKIRTMVSPEVAVRLIQTYQTQLSQTPGTAVPSSVQSAFKFTPLSSQQIVVQAQTMIDSWIQQGYLVKDNKDFIINISYSTGILKINGKALPMLMSKSRFMPSPVTTPTYTPAPKYTPAPQR